MLFWLHNFNSMLTIQRSVNSIWNVDKTQTGFNTTLCVPHLYCVISTLCCKNGLNKPWLSNECSIVVVHTIYEQKRDVYAIKNQELFNVEESSCDRADLQYNIVSEQTGEYSIELCMYVLRVDWTKVEYIRDYK